MAGPASRAILPRMSRRLVQAVAGLMLLTLVGCAVGTAVLDDLEGGPEPEFDAAPEPRRDAAQPPQRDATTGDSSSGSDTGSGTGDAGATDTGAVDASNDSGPGPSCASPNTCPASQDLGSVSGDTGSGTRTSSATTSKWLKVRITEDDDGIIGSKLKVRISLSSPPGSNFDLYAYLPGGSSGVLCTGPTSSSTNSGAPDEVTFDWGEGLVPNGSDDSRNVSIEVRHVSGTCAAGQSWTLTVRGNP